MSFSPNHELGQSPVWPTPALETSLSHDTKASDFRKKLQNASETQKKLIDSRTDVLLQRDAIRASAGRIREKRIAAGDAEAAFLNVARRFINRLPEHLSLPLFSAYARLEETRNELGVLETDHLEAEQALNGSEWELVDMENDFYQFDIDELLEDYGELSHFDPKSVQIPGALPIPPPPPPPPFFPTSFPPPLPPAFYTNVSLLAPPPPLPPTPAPVVPNPVAQGQSSNKTATEIHQAALAQHEDLTKDFDDLRQEQARRIEEKSNRIVPEGGEELDDPTGSDFAARYMNLIGKIADCEAEIQRSRTTNSQGEQPLVALPRDHPNLSDSGIGMLMGECQPKHFLTKSSIAALSGKLSVMQSIQNWLLLELKENAVHRQLYQNILREFGIEDLDNESLKQWATLHWGVDKSGDEGKKYTPQKSIASQARSLDGHLGLGRDQGRIHQEDGWPTKEWAQSDPGNPYSGSIAPSLDATSTGLSKSESITTILKPDFTSYLERASVFENGEEEKKPVDSEVKLSSSSPKDVLEEPQELKGQTNQEHSHDSSGESNGNDAGKESNSAPHSIEAFQKSQREIPTIVITEPALQSEPACPILTQATIFSPHAEPTPSVSPDPEPHDDLESPIITQNEAASCPTTRHEPTSPTSSTPTTLSPCDHAFHIIRINATSIKRSKSVRGKGRRDRLFNSVRQRQRSNSTSAIFSPHNPEYTRELRERDLKLGWVFQGL